MFTDGAYRNAVLAKSERREVMTTGTATAGNQRGRNHSYTMLFSAAENTLNWLEESFVCRELPPSLIDELTDALSYARAHGDNPMTTTATESREQEHTPTPWALRDNVIESTVAWSDPPSEWNESGSRVTVVDLHGAMGGEKGDAEFIVTAVNAYDRQQQLIEQMREALHLAKADLYEGCFADSTASAIDAALAAAEGEGDR